MDFIILELKLPFNAYLSMSACDIWTLIPDKLSICQLAENCHEQA
jgi:hypothetical protein